MRTVAVALIIAIGVSSASAQTPTLNDRIANQIGTLAIQNVDLGMKLEQAQAAIANLKGQIADLQKQLEEAKAGPSGGNK